MSKKDHTVDPKIHVMRLTETEKNYITAMRWETFDRMEISSEDYRIIKMVSHRFEKEMMNNPIVTVDFKKSDINDLTIKSLVNIEPIEHIGHDINTSNTKYDLTMNLIKDMIKTTRPYWPNPIGNSDMHFGMSPRNFEKLNKIVDTAFAYYDMEDNTKISTIFGIEIIINAEFEDWIYLIPLSSIRKYSEKIFIVNYPSIIRRSIK